MAAADQNCTIVGAGVIGICCGVALLERGYKVTLYDPESPGSMTSSGNAGAFAFTEVMPLAYPGLIWRVPEYLLDPCGPLFIRLGHMPALLPWLIWFGKVSTHENVERLSKTLTSLHNAGMIDSRELINKANLNHLFTETGAITIYKTKKQFNKDALAWELKSARGIQVKQLGADDIKAMEPALTNANYGWYTPQWCNTTNPYTFTRALADYFQQQGGEIVRTKIVGLAKVDNRVRALQTIDGKHIDIDSLVIAAGVWSKTFCEQLNDRVLIESERGYNTTLPRPGVTLNHQVIFGDEKFVISSIDDGLRIGGAAEFAGLEAPPNYRRCERLLEIASRYLPNLDVRDATQWMGHRPSTPDSIPIIGPSKRYKNVQYAFGHGHYGLTMAATTGKSIARLVADEPAEIDLSPFSIERFA